MFLVAVACGGQSSGDSFYNRGVADSSDPGVCDVVETAVEQYDGDLEAVRNTLMLAGLDHYAGTTDPDDPLPNQTEMGRYADGVKAGCGVTEAEG